MAGGKRVLRSESADISKVVRSQLANAIADATAPDSRCV
jgi:hypothetical protein